MSSPQSLTALGAFGGPWTRYRRTVVALSTSETALPPIPMPNRMGFTIYNPSTTTVYCGPTGVVSTGNERTLRPQGTLAYPVTDAVSIFGIVASGTPSVVVEEYG